MYCMCIFAIVNNLTFFVSVPGGLEVVTEGLLREQGLHWHLWSASQLQGQGLKAELNQTTDP